MNAPHQQNPELYGNEMCGNASEPALSEVEGIHPGTFAASISARNKYRKTGGARIVVTAVIKTTMA
jgi:hypothetical protein